MKLLCWAVVKMKTECKKQAPAQIPTQNLTYYNKRETTKRRGKNKKEKNKKKRCFCKVFYRKQAQKLFHLNAVQLCPNCPDNRVAGKNWTETGLKVNIWKLQGKTHTQINGPVHGHTACQKTSGEETVSERPELPGRVKENAQRFCELQWKQKLCPSDCVLHCVLKCILNEPV